MTVAKTICTKTYTLNDGTNFPAVGLGTFQGTNGVPEEQEIINSVKHALKSGYRLIDTAMAYGVEPAIGRAIRESGIPRSEIIVMTKFWVNFNDDPATALQICLDSLGLDYIDIFLMHYPCAMTRDMKPIAPGTSPTIAETWKLMEGLVGEKCRSIGVCNLTQKTMDELLGEARMVPVLNQVELHAFNPNHKLVDYCKKKGIHVCRAIGGMFAKNDVLTHPLFTGIAEAHHCSPAVVSLSWAVQRGCSVIPRSGRHERIEDNIKLETLIEEEMASINEVWEKIEKYRIADFIPQIQIPINGKTTVLGWTKVDMGWEDEQGNWLC